MIFKAIKACLVVSLCIKLAYKSTSKHKYKLVIVVTKSAPDLLKPE